MRRPAEVQKSIRDLGVDCPSEWLLKNKRMISFHDLRGFPWERVCDRGTVEEFGSDEWACSQDQDRRREFVQLLNAALQEKLFPEVRPWRNLGVYAFGATRDLKPRKIRYFSRVRPAYRTVFEVYTYERSGREYTYYRHLAFSGRFRLHEQRWYLEITPTYVFTMDGWRLHPRHSDFLAGIKLLDRQRAALAQLLLWAHYLQEHGDLPTLPYPFLTFGRLREFTLDVGIDDAAWQARDEVIVSEVAGEAPGLAGMQGA
jgi:hypothetical protein